jgi:hypothetical protein
MANNTKNSNKTLFRLFLKQSSELGSILFYLGIIMCLIPYKTYGIMILCLFGAACSIYNIFNAK